jgi:TatA/E family protein of Tat protein translocase
MWWTRRAPGHAGAKEAKSQLAAALSPQSSPRSEHNQSLLVPGVQPKQFRRVAAFLTRQYDDSMNLGFSEMVFLFLLALLIFGPKKLPEIGRQIGKALNEFKRASNEFRSQIESEIANLEVEPSRQILPPARPPEEAVASGQVIEASTEPPPNSSAKASDA